MLENDLLHDGKAKSSTVRFGRKEGAEELCVNIAGNAGSVVEDGNALEGVAVALEMFAAKDDFSAVGRGTAGFGGVARQIEERLADQAIVAGNFTEGAFGAKADQRKRFRNFGNGAFDDRVESDLFVGNIERARVAEKFGDHVSDVAGLFENLVRVVGDFRAGIFGLDELRVSGNGGERIFEFVRDAGGKLAERCEIFLELHQFLQRREFGEVGEQANGAADVVRAFANGRDCDAELANVAGCVAVFDLLATKDFASGETFTDEAG